MLHQVNSITQPYLQRVCSHKCKKKILILSVLSTFFFFSSKPHSKMLHIFLARVCTNICSRYETWDYFRVLQKKNVYLTTSIHTQTWIYLHSRSCQSITVIIIKHVLLYIFKYCHYTRIFCVFACSLLGSISNDDMTSK